jgi:hypothetical protein
MVLRPTCFWNFALQISHRCHVLDAAPLLAIADSEGNITLHQLDVCEVYILSSLAITIPVFSLWNTAAPIPGSTCPVRNFRHPLSFVGLVQPLDTKMVCMALIQLTIS